MTIWLYLTVAKQYLVRAVQNSNNYLIAAQIGVLIFCFGATTGPPALLFVLASVLSALVFREKYMHHALGAPREAPPPLARFYVESAGDAVISMVFMLLAETLALKYAPSLAAPYAVLYRGIVICLPLIAILRMVLRPKPPAPRPPFTPSRKAAMHLFWRTWGLNILWLSSFYGLILQDVTDDPHSLLDPLRGGVPLLTFVYLIVLGRDGLLRHFLVISLSINPETQRMIRLKETLLHILEPGEPLYCVSRFLEFMIFVELAVSMGAAVWPWVSGQSPEGGFLQIAARLVAFGTAVVSWKYVKEANAAAAKALQYQIGASGLVPVPA